MAMGFPRQEYWSGLPSPSPGDLPDIGIEPLSPDLAVGFFTADIGEAHVCIYIHTHTYTYMCITESLCYIPETNTTL